MKPYLLLGLKTFFRGTIGVSLILSFSVYAWARILFYEVPFSAKEDFSILFKLTGLSWAMILGLKGSLYSFIAIGELLQRRVNFSPFAKWVGPCVIILLLSAILFSCQAQSSAGIKKDFNTGLTATYKNIEPGEVLLVMNDEVLNHTDIPIGESFLLINKNIKGLVEKNDKVSVGCSLTISDKKGKKLLEAADLFKDNDVFNKKDVTYLKCTVSTGEPMQWEEHYDVVATFWDKWGTGKIVNKVTIRMIDIP
jgi:hypothetical protein